MGRVRRQNEALAVFDLAHLETLSDVPSLVALLSERTMYLLYNLAASDISQAWRYSTGFLSGGYVPLLPSDDDYGLFVSVVEKAQVEILEVTELYGFLAQLDNRAGPIAATTEETINETPASDPEIIEVGPVPAGEIWHCTQQSLRVLAGSVYSVYFNILREDEISHTVAGPILGADFLDGTDWHESGSWWLGRGDTGRLFCYGTESSTQLSFKLAVAKYVLPLDEE